jgi:hypothetical protein
MVVLELNGLGYAFAVSDISANVSPSLPDVLLPGTHTLQAGQPLVALAITFVVVAEQPFCVTVTE